MNQLRRNVREAVPDATDTEIEDALDFCKTEVAPTGSTAQLRACMIAILEYRRE
jgi:hypothetical protein